jgi:hypothetical protein
MAILAHEGAHKTLDFFEAFSKGSTPFEDVHNSPA